MTQHITEREFQNTVIEAAQACGWRVAHFRPGMTSRVDRQGKPIWVTAVQADGRGFPDLVLVRGNRLLFAEIKSQKGKVTVEQQAWLDALGVGLVEVYVWRPGDWPTIEAALT